MFPKAREIILQAHKAFRVVEGVHTLVWLFPGIVGLVGAGLGIVEGIRWFWIVTLVPTAMAATTYLVTRVAGETGYITLKEAARKACDECRDSDWDMVARRMTKGGDDVLDYYAIALTGKSSLLRVFGRRPPSTVIELVPKKAVSSHSMIGAAALQEFGQALPAYVDLLVLRRELNQEIRRMKRFSIT